MNDTPEWIKGKNTKLYLFHDKWGVKKEISTAKLPTLPYANQSLGYNFQFEMPVVRSLPITKEYKTIFGKTKTRNSGQDIYLVFSKELSEEELKFWRVFKLGFLTAFCAPLTVTE